MSEKCISIDFISKCGSRGKIATEGYKVGEYLGVHLPHKGREIAGNKQIWVLTHLPTGFRVGAFKGKTAAMNLARHLSLTYDFNCIEPDTLARRLEKPLSQDIVFLRARFLNGVCDACQQNAK